MTERWDQYKPEHEALVVALHTAEFGLRRAIHEAKRVNPSMASKLEKIHARVRQESKECFTEEFLKELSSDA